MNHLSPLIDPDEREFHEPDTDWLSWGLLAIADTAIGFFGLAGLLAIVILVAAFCDTLGR